MPRKNEVPAYCFDVPPDGDPSWGPRCAPFLDFVRAAPQRTNADIAVWRTSQKISANMMTQMLAWCCNRKLVSYTRDGAWAIGRQPKTPF